VAFLDLAGDGETFLGKDQAAIFFVVEVTEFAQFLDHAGDGRLLDLEGRSDIDHAGIALFADQFVDSFQVILSTLAR